MEDARRLAEAVWAGNVAQVKALIAAGVDVNRADSTCDPPLHLAIEQMEVEVARLLIAAGADVNRKLGKGWTPLAHAVDVESDAAAQEGLTIDQVSTALTEMLLSAGATPCEHAIELAQKYGNHKVLLLILRAKGA